MTQTWSRIKPLLLTFLPEVVAAEFETAGTVLLEARTAEPLVAETHRVIAATPQARLRRNLASPFRIVLVQRHHRRSPPGSVSTDMQAKTNPTRRSP